MVNGHNGAPMGSPAFTADRYGTANSAIQLNGTNQYVQLPDETSFDLTAFTLYAIVSVPDFQNHAIIIDKPRDTSGYGNYCLDILPASTPGNAGKAGYVHDIPMGNWSNIVTSSAIPVDTFVHVAVTFSGSAFTGYYNGARTYAASAVTAPVLANNDVIIGAHLGFGFYFKGAIDEILIYNRPLTSAEIAQLYNALR